MDNEKLIEKAKEIKINALAEITGYKVGAVLLTEDDEIYYGVNVEDKYIPNLSICAERNAFQAAITMGKRTFTKIAVVGGMGEDIDDTLTPCGICLQYMLDMSPDIKIISYVNGNIKESSVKDFLTVPFMLSEKRDRKRYKLNK